MLDKLPCRMDGQVQVLPYRRQHDRACAFLAAAAALDRTVRSMSLDAWTAFAEMEMNQGARDFAFAAVGDSIAGLLMSSRRDVGSLKLRHLRVIVHPGCRRRGIGRTLLDHAASQDSDPSVQLQATCPGDWDCTREFLLAHGFKRVITEVEMQKAAHACARAPAAADGIQIRLLQHDDREPALAGLHNEAYQGHFGFAPLSARSFREARANPSNQFLIAIVENKLAGFVQMITESEDVAVVESLVVRESARRRGIGRALLQSGIAWALGAADTTTAVELKVETTNTAALQLYTSEGFVSVNRVEGYRRCPHGRP